MLAVWTGGWWTRRDAGVEEHGAGACAGAATPDPGATGGAAAGSGTHTGPRQGGGTNSSPAPSKSSRCYMGSGAGRWHLEAVCGLAMRSLAVPRGRDSGRGAQLTGASGDTAATTPAGAAHNDWLSTCRHPGVVTHATVATPHALSLSLTRPPPPPTHTHRSRTSRRRAARPRTAPRPVPPRGPPRPPPPRRWPCRWCCRPRPQCGRWRSRWTSCTR